jgi:hypothetical protein
MKKNLSGGFCRHAGIRDTLKSECSAKNFKERGRGFAFKEHFSKYQ